MCGEKLVTEFITRYMMGSPLRVRGKVGPVIQLRAGPGITPACVGKSIRPSSMASVPWDHPRVCGEKVVFPLFRSFRLGLPPRMRGKAERAAAAANRRRITPAHAGKSTLVNSTTKPQRDHPRLCGEKAAYFRAECVPRGSPPRVRGKAVQFHHRHNGVGITPACAGKSHVLPRPAQVQWDHPRVCGEKKKAEEMGATTKGSPPRMRGKA